MTALPRLDDGGGSGVELLERAIGYTRGALAGVNDDALSLPTPCAAWNLAELLAHMEDALDAFAEGAAGRIDLRVGAASALEVRLTTLREKACALLGAWAAEPTGMVGIGRRQLPVPLVSRVAAIEIVVHGWDVHRALGHRSPIPDELADALLPTAHLVVEESSEFGAPTRTPADAPGGVRLLALTGRRAV